MIADGALVGEGVVGRSPVVGGKKPTVGAGDLGTAGAGVPPGEGIATGAGVGGSVRTGRSSS